MLGRLFTSGTRVKLLALFLMNPEREMYIREIVRTTGANINSIRRELANLEEIGLLTSTRKGNLKYYATNKKMPIYDELTSIILKTEGIAKVLKNNLAVIGNLKIAFIYGSFARGDTTTDSDIDLFIIGDVDEDKLIVTVREIEEKLSREINYVLYTPEEFEERLRNNDPFVSNVMKETKIIFIGDLHEPK